MSKPESQHCTDGAICPYCLNHRYVEPGDYSEDSRREECEACGKEYILHQYLCVTHHTFPVEAEDNKPRKETT